MGARVFPRCTAFGPRSFESQKHKSASRQSTSSQVLLFRGNSQSWLATGALERRTSAACSWRAGDMADVLSASETVFMTAVKHSTVPLCHLGLILDWCVQHLTSTMH
ncbi:hypothetical protein HPB47_020811 [Ixodes persulcatus]|uniref:Uncharacterized protein n=1 Tax=Ixodes persulcatus TaxID=34615 RepID=A0AC60QE98_IXOPE|nr:hypothetical protein HPB47_020811 [Ixodes persulcatus]